MRELGGFDSGGIPNSNMSRVPREMLRYVFSLKHKRTSERDSRRN